MWLSYEKSSHADGKHNDPQSKPPTWNPTASTMALAEWSASSWPVIDSGGFLGAHLKLHLSVPTSLGGMEAVRNYGFPLIFRRAS